MKLVEILPEIEKGRRFKLRGKNTWLDKNTRFAAFYPCHLFDDDWELEPEPEKKKMEGLELGYTRVNEKGEFQGQFQDDGQKLFKTQRRALAHAIRTLLKEFEGEKE